MRALRPVFRLFVFAWSCRHLCEVVASGQVRGRYRLVRLARVGHNASTITTTFRKKLALRAAARHREPLVIGVYICGSHDNALAATLGGQVLGVIELERFFKLRYFDISWAAGRYEEMWDWGSIKAPFPDMLPKRWEGEDVGHFTKRFDAALQEQLVEEDVARFVVPALSRLCEIVSRQLGYPSVDVDHRKKQCEVDYDAAVLASSNLRPQQIFLKKLQRVIRAAEWAVSDHHHAHAAAGWLDSPFYYRSAGSESVSLVLSYDGTGNDATLRTFLARSGNATLTPIGQNMKMHSFGLSYTVATSIVRDLAWGSPYGSTSPCCYYSNPSCVLALAGSFMAYAAVGTIRDAWQHGAKMLLTRGVWEDELWPSPNGGHCELKEQENNTSGCPHHFFSTWVKPYFHCAGADEPMSRRLDQDFAATVQYMFETIILAEVKRRLSRVSGPSVTSLVVTGGCALNVKVNSALARGLDLPTHVPSAPSDNGLALGAAWLAAPPVANGLAERLKHHPPHFAGAPLTQHGELVSRAQLQMTSERWGATRLQSVERLAELLLGGAIIGVARGRAEFGPRALGHRSLLSAAHLAEQKDRLNRLKHRKWYRPCAPIVAAEDLEHVFEPGPDLALGSPYMSFGPPLQSWVPRSLPAIAHLDNTARPQGVRKEDDSWMHALLEAVRSASALRLEKERATSAARLEKKRVTTPAVGVLINTSLNPKGKPIAGDVDDILMMFCGANGNELDYVLLEEEWLFERATAISRGLCASFQSSQWSKKADVWPDQLPPI